jgi:hypothetical protein
MQLRISISVQFKEELPILILRSKMRLIRQIKMKMISIQRTNLILQMKKKPSLKKKKKKKIQTHFSQSI